MPLMLLVCLQALAAQVDPAVAAAAPPGADRSTILVLDLTAAPGVKRELVPALSEQMALQVRRQNPQARVLGMQDVRAMLALEEQKSRLNCQEVSCLAEIGGALGAREVLNGSLAIVGDNYILTLKRVNARQVKVLADASTQVPVYRESSLIDAVRDEVRRLYPSATSEPSLESLYGDTETAPSPHSHFAGYALGAVAVLGLAAAGVGAAMRFSYSDPTPGKTSVNGAMDSARTANAGIGLLVAGGVLFLASGTGAVLTW